MANRSMDAKVKRARLQRQELGMAEGCKPAYGPKSKYHTKPALRQMASEAQHMVKNATPAKEVWVEPLTKLYNPSIYRKPAPLAMRCAVACDGELIRKADYLAR
jgi:hypothetical protein